MRLSDIGPIGQQAVLPAAAAMHVAAGPVWSEDYCGGAWLLTRYDDVAMALRDPRFSVRRAARWINSGLAAVDGRAAMSPAQVQFKRVFARSLLFVDGRAHRRLRAVVQVGFKPGDLQRQTPFIATMADRLIARIETDRVGEFDFVQAFARPLPALVIANLLGIAGLVPDAFIDWASDLAAFIGSPTPDVRQTRAAQQALADMCDFFAQVMATPDAIAADGLLARIVDARQAHRLTAIEALAQCCTLLFAGYETTRNLLGNGLLALLRHPAQWAALKASPQGLPAAVREMLRYDSPVQYTGRRLVADIELNGQRMKRGDLAILHIGAANHDAQRFSDPGRFDIRRAEGNHLSFGHGPHVCLGAALTQLEAEIAFTALMRVMPELRLGAAAPVWQDNSAYRALQHLSIGTRSQSHA
ncbi:cytochrome P450 [Herbaspirillum sp. alder98]|uniref:cytochrome P450 n=1 Tax=Herbaspirillum sp. alder98 TaxID=2913096 RepID=UPI001CD84D2E|nr:cytochrome P450 [Herbaspirillum sp. alder98]MCA1327051.1 cytochrome P450 [Herbaspirillum sp. alder98]